MMKYKQLIKCLFIGAFVYWVVIRSGEVGSEIALLLAFISATVWDLVSKKEKKPCILQLIVTPRKGILQCPEYKEYYEKLHQKYAALNDEEKEKSDNSTNCLINEPIKFNIYDRLVWSENAKSVQFDIYFSGKLYGDLLNRFSPDEKKEPTFCLGVRNGLLNFHFLPDPDNFEEGDIEERLDRMNEAYDNPICQFPLLIFSGLPGELMNWGDESEVIKKQAKLFRKIRNSNIEKRIEMEKNLIKEYGFEYVVENEDYQFRDPYEHYKNKYFEIDMRVI